MACPIPTPADVSATNRGGTGLAVVAADVDGNRVQVFAAGTGSCAAFPLDGSDTPGGALDGPHGVAFGADGRIFVSDTGNNRVLRFDSLDGLSFGDAVPFLNVVEPTLGQSTVFTRPEGLDASDDGRLFVADTGNRRILILTPSGQIEDTIGPTVTIEPIQNGFQFVSFDEPSDVAVCGQSAAPEYRGRFFVVDRGGDRVFVFGSDNEYLFQIGRTGSAVNDFDRPSSIAVDDACVVYVADTGNDRVQVFSSDGAILEVFDTPGDPVGISVQPGEGVFVASDQSGSVARRLDVSYDPDANGRIDDDGDGLPDLWEIEGIDTDFNGTVELDLPALGALPRRRDIFLELDHMAGRDALATAVADVVGAFADAPLQNPDNSTGVALHVENLSDQIPFEDFILLSTDSGPVTDFGDIRTQFFGSPAQRAGANADAVLFAKSLVFHYGVMANTACGTIDPNDPTACASILPNSGFAFRGGNFVVLLRDERVREDQALVIMHELGHTLGLGHGGLDNLNCKPNYLSVMNYIFASSGVLTDVVGVNRLDYSGDMLDTLDEERLDETVGLNNGCDLRTRWNRNGEGVTQFGSACGPLSWSGDPNFVTQAAINLTNVPGISDCSDDALTELESHDDWVNLVYDFRAQRGRLPRENSSIFAGTI
ncbi:MAG: NHL repeat-containing protein, partial [Planctomycetes bacterium]|nr:NHL repeat-containing protein [Planctomycetota bacterium]